MQYQNGSEQSTTFAAGKLTWPDGTEGIMETGVTNIITRKPDMFNGGVSTFSTTGFSIRPSRVLFEGGGVCSPCSPPAIA